MVLLSFYGSIRKGWTLQLISLLLLVGCAQPPKLKYTKINTEPNIKVRFTTDFTHIRKRYNDRHIVGLALLFKDSCTIYIPPPNHVLDSWSMCIAGHELMHCIYGQFHGPDYAHSCS